MTDDPNIPGWVYQLAGFLLTIFGLGKAWGSMIQKDKSQTERIDQLEADIRKLRTTFINEDGEPKFISYPAHDKMQEHCQRFIMAELSHIKETCDEIKKRINRRRSDPTED